MGKRPGLGERACPKCKETIKADASICKHCRTEFSAEEMAQAKKDAQYNNKITGVGCLIVILLLGYCTYKSGDEYPTDAEIGEVVYKQEKPSAATNLNAVPEPSSNLTRAQQNAVRSAEQYLNSSSFSRAGLIDQLSSDAGEGFELADATAAVNSLTVDWNAQAAKSAGEYLKMSGFSCKGLIEQLSSSAGEKFTKSEATYAAQQAGAC